MLAAFNDSKYQDIMLNIVSQPMVDLSSNLQLEGRGLLPFTLAKQNLLLASLDTIGVTSQLGMGWMDLFNVSQAQRWSPSHNDFGSVNFTIVSARSQFDGGSMGEVIFRNLLEHSQQCSTPANATVTSHAQHFFLPNPLLRVSQHFQWPLNGD